MQIHKCARLLCQKEVDRILQNFVKNTSLGKALLASVELHIIVLSSGKVAKMPDFQA